MGENVWDFRKRLTLLFGSAVIIAVVFFIFKVLFYYVWPFMLAFCFAVLLQKPIVGLAKLLREKKTLAASIVVTMVTLIIFSVLLYVGYMAFRELKDFIANFDENINSIDGQFKLVCCRIDGWIKLKEGCSYAFFEKCKGIIIDGDGQQMFFTIMRKHSVPVITWLPDLWCALLERYMRRLELRSTEAGGRTLYLRTKSGRCMWGFAI